MNWAEELAQMLDNVSDQVSDLAPAFDENSADFKNVFVKKGKPLLRSKLRKSPSEAREFNMSSEEGKFLMEREALFESALEG